VVPFSAIERAADSKNVSERNIESEKAEIDRVAAAAELRRMMEAEIAEKK
jgi:hypothetical protein